MDRRQMGDIAARWSRRRVGPTLGDVGEIDWLICDPHATDVGRDVVSAAVDHLRTWRVRRWGADGNLPCLGVYGVPDAWPHVQRLLTGAGFTDDGGQIEVVLAGEVAAIGRPGPAPVTGLDVRRVTGSLGVAFQAVLDGTVVGEFEVDDVHGTSNRALAHWADEGDHWVEPGLRRRGIGTWLVRHGAAWLRLGGTDRLMTYATERWSAEASPREGTAEQWIRYYGRFGLEPISRTRRGWHRLPD